MIKPGYRTSEFWFTLVSFIFSGLFLLGVVQDNSQKEQLISDISHAVESCILIGGQLLIVYKYIMSRYQVKKIVAENSINATIDKEKENKNDAKSTKPKSTRSSKTKNTRTNNSKSTKPTKSQKRSDKWSLENIKYNN